MTATSSLRIVRKLVVNGQHKDWQIDLESGQAVVREGISTAECWRAATLLATLMERRRWQRKTPKPRRSPAAVLVTAKVPCEGGVSMYAGGLVAAVPLVGSVD